MSWAITAVTVVTSLVSAGVAYSGAKKQEEAQRQAAAYDARNDRLQADQERETAAENARRTRQANKRKIAQMRARASSGNIAFDGSLMDSLAESSSVLEKQAGDVFRQGLARGQQYESQSAMTLFEGGLMADATRTAATANLVGDLAGTATSGYQTYKLS